jgi:hypothetical protein
MEQYHGSIEDAKKLRGAVASELLRQKLDQYIAEHGKELKVSPVNAYIAGSKFEYDLLVVKAGAEAYMNLVYRPEDVVAVIESKAGGLFDVDADTSNIARAVNRAMALNPKICFGYITMSENVPVHECKKNGEPTVKHWKLTNQYLQEKIDGKSAIYAVTLHRGKQLYDPGSDQEFEDFAAMLIGEV